MLYANQINKEMRLKVFYSLLFLTATLMLKAQPKEGEPGSKGSYKAQGFYTTLSDNENGANKHYELWYEGVEIMSGQYSQDKKEGLWRQTSLTGDVFFQGNYIQNKKNGAWKYFYNQKPQCVLYYKDGKRDSLQQSFYENGKIQSIENYSSGLKNGSFKLFYDNGNLSSEMVYRNDTIIGNHITYDKVNIIKTNIEYRNGTPYNIIVMNDSLGHPIDFGNFKNGTGLLKTYFDGKKVSEVNYENGISTMHFDSKPRDIVVMAEKMPSFPGGDKGMMSFIKNCIKFPPDSYGTVYVTFKITDVGDISDISILRGASHDIN